MRRFAALTTAAAVLFTTVGLSATSAEARSRYGGWGHRHHDRISTGEVIGGLLVLGTIAAIASSASNDSRNRQRDRDREYRYDPPYREDQRYEQPQYQPQVEPQRSGSYGAGEAEARATDACSWAVEGELGDGARIDRIDGTRQNGGEVYVSGTASTYQGTARSFGCTYRGGRVVDVQFAR